MFILAELGDYDPVQHTPELVSEFRFVPDQTEEMEIDILNFYKTCKYVYPQIFRFINKSESFIT